jgi:hypothetical protein
MKTTLLLILCVSILTSCVQVQGTGYKATFVATDATGVNVSADGASFAEVRQSDSVKHVTDAATTITRIKSWFGLATTATTELGDVGQRLID